MTDKELMQQALNALERNVQHKYPYEQDAAIRLGEDAIAALKARLEQPDVPEVDFGNMLKKAGWVGLTDDEIKGIIGPWGGAPIKGYTRTLFDQIEAKLKEKNT